VTNSGFDDNIQPDNELGAGICPWVFRDSYAHAPSHEIYLQRVGIRSPQPGGFAVIFSFQNQGSEAPPKLKIQQYVRGCGLYRWRLNICTSFICCAVVTSAVLCSSSGITLAPNLTRFA
jgi:hypothetical protein